MSLLKRSDISRNIRLTEVAMEHHRHLQDIELTKFDIFLSHSFNDKNLVYGLKKYLEDRSLTVYIDWIEDADYDRSVVNEKTAYMLRKRMKQCTCLLYATSSNSEHSKWMPWECGFFDGIKGKVGIIPIAETDESSFKGQEYLAIYPYIDVVANTIWINDPISGYCELEDWLNGASPKSD